MPKQSAAPLALFDLDHTLLSGDSDHAWGQFLIDEGVVDRATYEERNQAYYDQYQAGVLDIHEFLNFALAPLATLAPAQLETLRVRFVAARITPMITDAARALVEHHRGLGHRLVIITATNRFVTAPIARAFGIDDLIATEAEQAADGWFTGRAHGTPCFREGKVERLSAWLASRGGEPAESWFYSDSHNDLPLLERVTHPVAVDPDPALLAAALVRGWPVMSLR